MSDEFKGFDDIPQPELVFGAAPQVETAAQAVTEAAAAVTAAASAQVQAATASVQSQAAAAAPVQTQEEAAAFAAQVAQAAENAAKPQVSEAVAGLNEDMLTEHEREQVDQFSKTIDISNSSAVLQYGAGAQKKLSDFSEKALENVRTKDLGEVGDMIAQLSVELKNFDTEESKGGFLGLFKKNVPDKLTNLKAKYEKAEVNVDKISQSLEDHQVQLIKDIAVLDKMYELNLAYYKELTMYILAGKKRLQEVRANELAELNAKAAASGLAEDAQAARDLDEKCERFEKRLYDLELTRTVALQTAPQIRLVQDSDNVMVEKIQSTLVNTIPLWKNQMVIAMGIEHSNQAAKAQQQVTDLTNQLLMKNAEKLKTATVETAKAAERGVLDIETLKNTNQSLIATLDEVVKIQEEGRAKRRQAEADMAQMEKDLKDKLLYMSNT